MLNYARLIHTIKLMPWWWKILDLLFLLCCCLVGVAVLTDSSLLLHWVLCHSCDLAVPTCPMSCLNSALDRSSLQELKNKNKCLWWIGWAVWLTEVKTTAVKAQICFGYKIPYVNRHMLTVHRVICVSLLDVRNFAIFKERNSQVRLFSVPWGVFYKCSKPRWSWWRCDTETWWESISAREEKFHIVLWLKKRLIKQIKGSRDLYARVFSGALGHETLAQLSLEQIFILKVDTPSVFQSVEPQSVKEELIRQASHGRFSTLVLKGACTALNQGYIHHYCSWAVILFILEESQRLG